MKLIWSVTNLLFSDVFEFEIVTPDGNVRTANQFQEQDLFWALRGGGGSAFGIVVESTHKVEPKLTLQA